MQVLEGVMKNPPVQEQWEAMKKQCGKQRKQGKSRP
jgi:hypothetical protein